MLVTCTGPIIKTVSLDCPEESGISVDKHILVIRNARCCDIALDKKGNHYYFYMVDKNNNLRALVTETVLTPTKELEEDILEFYLCVIKEIEKDGGIEKLLKKLKESEICQCPEHRGKR
jgi:hypothetical protein